MNLRIPLGAVLLALALSGGASAGHDGWRTFASPTGFSVDYPATWGVLQSDPYALDALSPGHREEGVIIGPRQAELRVEQLPKGESVRTALQAWVKGERVIKPPVRMKLPTNCRPAMAEDAEGEGPPDRTLALFCSVDDRTFRVTVRYWADDPASKAHQSVAVSAASSIRINVQ